MSVLAVSHVHSSWSFDGSWPIGELVAAFSRRGYHVMLTTEHDRGFSDSRLAAYREECARYSTPAMLVVPGIEYSDADNRVHVLVWGSVPFLGAGLPTDQLLEAVAQHGGVAVLAHPERRGAWESVGEQWQERLLGVEVWNRRYDGWAPSDRALALVRRAGRIPFVGVDFHTERQFFPLGMRLGVDAAAGEEQVVAALRAGRCAATAMGVPLNDSRFERRLPYLRAAERGRRHFRSMTRQPAARSAR